MFKGKLCAFLLLPSFLYLNGCQSPNVQSAQSSPSPPAQSPTTQSPQASEPLPEKCSQEEKKSKESDCYEDASLDWLLRAIATIPVGSYQGFIVDLRNDAPDFKELEREGNLQVSVSESLADEKTYLLQGDSEVLVKLKNSRFAGYIEYIEPNYIYEQASGVSANDPYFSSQWNLHRINIEKAWSFTKGKGTTVAVLDSGVTFVRDFKPDSFSEGFDLVSERTISAPPSDDPQLSSGGNTHGTHIAGIIGQATNNGLGFAGIAPDTKLMPVRVLDKNGNGTALDIAEGIRWSASNGANVINLSLAIKASNPFLATAKNISIWRAIKYAQSQGVVIVAAAGNYGKQEVLYPASDANVIAVSAYNSQLGRAAYSNYGSRIKIYAPGGQDLQTSKANCQTPTNILNPISLIQKNGITQWVTGKIVNGPIEDLAQSCYGTSQATAHVSGVAALVQSILLSKGIKDPDLVRKILISSTQKDCKEPKSPDTFDAPDSVKNPASPGDPFTPGRVGRLDAGRAVQLAEQMTDPKMRDNIALARHLTQIGAKVYGNYTCSINSEIKTAFGEAAFQELRYIELPEHNRAWENRGWEIKGKFYSFFDSSFLLSLEYLADISGYSGGRNFVISEEYEWEEKEYKQQKEYEAEQRRSQPPQR